MSAASFKASGFTDLDGQLARLARGVPEARQREILHEGAGLIVAEAKRLVPVDTGDLRDSITSADERDARVYGTVGIGGANRAGISIYVGPVGSTEDGDVYYAKFQEFGWLDYPGQPFMRPAIAAKREEADRLIMSRLAADVIELAR